MSKNKGEKGNLLLELFSEEIPARMQTGSEIQLTNLFEKSLMNRDIGYGPISTFCSPRHLSVIIKNIDLKQKNQIIEKRGPRLGSNEKAIHGFLKSNNIQESDIVIKDMNLISKNLQPKFCKIAQPKTVSLLASKPVAIN